MLEQMNNPFEVKIFKIIVVVVVVCVGGGVPQIFPIPIKRPPWVEFRTF